MKKYSKRYLSLRRKVLSWIQGSKSSTRPIYWSNLDQQERFEGDMGFSHMKKANSPLHKWKMNQKWPIPKPEKFPPMKVLYWEAIYQLRCALPHREWLWSLTNGDRAPYIMTVVKMLLYLLSDIPNYTYRHAMVALWLLSQGMFGFRYRRYPEELKFNFDQKDLNSVYDRFKEIEKKGIQLTPELKKTLLHGFMLEVAVIRRLRLNLPWLTCVYAQTIKKNVLQIYVTRSKRILALYHVPIDTMRGNWEIQKYGKTNQFI